MLSRRYVVIPESLTSTSEEGPVWPDEAKVTVYHPSIKSSYEESTSADQLSIIKTEVSLTGGKDILCGFFTLENVKLREDKIIFGYKEKQDENKVSKIGLDIKMITCDDRGFAEQLSPASDELQYGLEDIPEEFISVAGNDLDQEYHSVLIAERNPISVTFDPAKLANKLLRNRDTGQYIVDKCLQKASDGESFHFRDINTTYDYLLDCGLVPEAIRLDKELPCNVFKRLIEESDVYQHLHQLYDIKFRKE